MSLPILLRGLALADLEDAHDWYEREEPGLGERFAETVRARLHLLAADPLRYPVVRRNVRAADLPGFPSYCIYYVVEPTRLRVISVFHNSRDPSIWKRRR
jgi:toxin ParE1/3/4